VVAGHEEYPRHSKNPSECPKMVNFSEIPGLLWSFRWTISLAAAWLGKMVWHLAAMGTSTSSFNTT